MAEVKSLRERMAETAKRAKALESNPNIRWTPSEHDLRVMRENTVFMMPYQTETIKECCTKIYT